MPKTRVKDVEDGSPEYLLPHGVSIQEIGVHFFTRILVTHSSARFINT